MEANSAAMAPARPGKTSAWIPLRSVQDEAAENSSGVTYPHPPEGVNSLDGVRSAFWQAYRHLFPPHSLAAQTAGGSILISWSVLDEPQARYPYAAPVMLRFDETLVDLMAHCDARQRIKIAEKHEGTLRQGLRGYDPFARFPNARVVTIG
jgi:hypothetical protein